MIMDKILLINACVRPCSRTLELTDTLLKKLNGDVQEIKLYETPLPILDMNGMEKRKLAERKTARRSMLKTLLPDLLAVGNTISCC